MAIAMPRVAGHPNRQISRRADVVDAPRTGLRRERGDKRDADGAGDGAGAGFTAGHGRGLCAGAGPSRCAAQGGHHHCGGDRGPKARIRRVFVRKDFPEMVREIGPATRASAGTSPAQDGRAPTPRRAHVGWNGFSSLPERRSCAGKGAPTGTDRMVTSYQGAASKSRRDKPLPRIHGLKLG